MPPYELRYDFTVENLEKKFLGPVTGQSEMKPIAQAKQALQPSKEGLPSVGIAVMEQVPQRA